MILIQINILKKVIKVENSSFKNTFQLYYAQFSKNEDQNRSNNSYFPSMSNPRVQSLSNTIINHNNSALPYLDISRYMNLTRDFRFPRLRDQMSVDQMNSLLFFMHQKRMELINRIDTDVEYLKRCGSYKFDQIQQQIKRRLLEKQSTTKINESNQIQLRQEIALSDEQRQSLVKINKNIDQAKQQQKENINKGYSSPQKKMRLSLQLFDKFKKNNPDMTIQQFVSFTQNNIAKFGIVTISSFKRWLGKRRKGEIALKKDQFKKELKNEKYVKKHENASRKIITIQDRNMDRQQ